MSRSRFVYLILALFVMGLVYVQQRPQSSSSTEKLGNLENNSSQPVESPLETPVSIKNGTLKSEVLSKADQANGALENTVETKTNLTISNFEGSVGKCFQGEVCDFADDPISMYRFFKRSGNESACDSLISFLRKKMQEVAYRERYKDVLKKMIDDFYPPEEKQFQEAAYYNYLGDLQKSLDLYLDLERKSQADSSLRQAPKLNIANTLYDMKRYKNSLPYYEAALQEFISHGEQGSTPSRNEMIRFVEGRIEDVKKRL